jgi:DNA-binding transcriptional MerR regulator
MNVAIPDKQYYKIGEVAQLVGVRTSVLRFWEAEFDFLKPKKSSTGQRLYAKKEVDQIQEVKRLLYDEKYTLEGVKKLISRGKLPIEGKNCQQRNEVDHRDLLNQIKSELLALRCQL